MTEVPTLGFEYMHIVSILNIAIRNEVDKEVKKKPNSRQS